MPLPVDLAPSPRHRQRTLLRVLPKLLRSPAMALFGLLPADDMVSLAWMAGCIRGQFYPLHIFYWQVVEAKRKLWLADIQNRWRNYRACRTGRRKQLAFLEVAQFHPLEERDSPDPRASWVEAVEHIVVTDPGMRVGMVVHPGAAKGTDILGDLQVINPIADEAVVVVITHPEKTGSARFVRRCVQRGGWHSIFLGGFALLQKTPFDVPMTEE